MADRGWWERLEVGAGDREGQVWMARSPAHTPGMPSFCSAGLLGQTPSLPSVLAGLKEFVSGICGGGVGGALAGQQELSGQKFSGEPGPQSSGTAGPGLATFFPLLNLIYPQPPEPLGVVSLQMHIPMRKLRPEKGIDFPFFITQQGG